MIHALIAKQSFDEARRRALTRRCPRCRHEQLTPEERLNGWVSCEKCETPIPPELHAVRGEPDAEGGA